MNAVIAVALIIGLCIALGFVRAGIDGVIDGATSSMGTWFAGRRRRRVTLTTAIACAR